MKFSNYLALFDEILERKITSAPYDDPHFYEYVKLNKSRMHRWLKSGVISEEMSNFLLSINNPTRWILITEPWCGDAAHSVPFIYLMASLNPSIELMIQLRDSDESEIEQYLTNNARSIPKLIIRDLEGRDLLIWGPRPQKCEALNANLMVQNADLTERKTALQQWYNQDKGSEIQRELLKGLKEIIS
jgi:hypothetical protein